MAHNFWFSYQQPPGSSSNASASVEHSRPLPIPHEHHAKVAQTDEEKQRERQKQESREKELQKQLEMDAALNKRDAREVHKLDLELLSKRRAQERERQAKLQQQHHFSIVDDRIQSTNNIGIPMTLVTTPIASPQMRELSQESSQSFEKLKSIKSEDVSSSSETHSSRQETTGKEEEQPTIVRQDSSRTPSPQKVSHLNVTTIPANTKPSSQFEPGRPRDDSTESDQSFPHSHSQADGLHKLTCRAPIASLDCMEEFSGTGGHLDFGRSISLGSNPALPIRHCTSATPGLRYKNLGKSGLRVSNVGLGTWSIFAPNISEEQAEAIIKLSFDSGINLFDLSEAHSGTRAEIELGKIIQKHNWKRTSFVITTKIYWSTKSDERGLSRKHIIESVQASIQRLQLPYIDIVIVHKADSMCPMEEIVRAMTYVINQGWAMYWGTARWSPVEIMEAYTNCRQFNCITPIVEQAEYHMFYREKAELYLPELYNKIGVGMMAWGPLAMCLGETQNGERILFPKGSFKAKSHSYSWTEDEVNKEERMEETRRHCDKVRDLSNLADKLGCTPVQLSIAWSLKHEPVQCLLLGATTAEQLHQSLQALQLLPRLSSGVMLEIERILDNKPIRPPPISTLALR